MFIAKLHEKFQIQNLMEQIRNLLQMRKKTPNNRVKKKLSPFHYVKRHQFSYQFSFKLWLLFTKKIFEKLNYEVTESNSQ